MSPAVCALRRCCLTVFRLAVLCAAFATNDFFSEAVVSTVATSEDGDCMTKSSVAGGVFAATPASSYIQRGMFATISGIKEVDPDRDASAAKTARRKAQSSVQTVPGVNRAHPNSDLVVGIAVGAVLSALTIGMAMGFCLPSKYTGSASSTLEQSAEPEVAETLPLPPQGLAGDQLQLPTVQFDGSVFRTFNWVRDVGGVCSSLGSTKSPSASSRAISPSRGGGGAAGGGVGAGAASSSGSSGSSSTDTSSLEDGAGAARGRGSGIRAAASIAVKNSDGGEVAWATGRLLARKNGEVRLEGPSCEGPWAVIKRPAPSRLPGQLWDFKVCRANGEPYAQVRQMSETKCIVEDTTTHTKILTVVGNFSYPAFLSGERSIHVWVQQAEGQRSIVGAQCESRVEPTSSSSSSRGVEMRRLHVTVNSSTDASLVMAVLLGLEDVHRPVLRAHQEPPPPAMRPAKAPEIQEQPQQPRQRAQASSVEAPRSSQIPASTSASASVDTAVPILPRANSGGGGAVGQEQIADEAAGPVGQEQIADEAAGLPTPPPSEAS